MSLLFRVDWTGTTDVDLALYEPEGDYIWFGDRGPSIFGGVLASDENIYNNPGTYREEISYFTTFPGTYDISITHYSGVDAQPYVLTIYEDDVLMASYSDAVLPAGEPDEYSYTVGVLGSAGAVGVIEMGGGAADETNERFTFIFKPTTQQDNDAIVSLGSTAHSLDVSNSGGTNAFLRGVSLSPPSGVPFTSTGSAVCIFDILGSLKQYQYVAANFAQQSWVKGGFRFSSTRWIEFNTSALWGGGVYSRTHFPVLDGVEYIAGADDAGWSHDVVFGAVQEGLTTYGYVRSGGLWSPIRSASFFGTGVGYFAYLTTGASIDGAPPPVWSIGSAMWRYSGDLPDTHVNCLDAVYADYLSV